MASIADILRTIQGTISNGINNAGIQTPGQVVIGWPTGPQMAAIMGAGEWLITLFPQKTRQATRYRPTPLFIISPSPASLTATITSGTTFSTIALSGANAAGLNINTVVGPNPNALDSLYQTTGMESLPQLASLLATQVNLLHAPGVTATPSGQSINVTGPYPVWCNIGQSFAAQIGGESNYVLESARFAREVLVTIWAASPDIFAATSDGTREALENAMVVSIGGTDQAWNFSPDGSSFSAIWQGTGDWSDKAESSYSTFRSDNYLTIEYGLLKPVAATQITGIQLITQVSNGAGFTTAENEYIGGP